jgi:hypothetical protein
MALTWADCYQQHFQQFFNKPFDVQTYRGADRASLRLGLYDLAYRDFRVYASLGLADLLPEGQAVGEVITVVDDPGPDVPFLLINALFFVLHKGIALDSRFTIGGIDKLRPQFAEFYDKSALYFMPAVEGFPEGFTPVPCGADEGGVYQAVFIADEEDEYIRDKGGAAFEAKIKAQTADVCRLRRLSCV